MLQKEKPELYAALDQKLGLAGLQKKWAEQRDKIFLTQPNENGVLPQDSTYLTLKDIDLSKYKQQAHVGGIYKDYNQEQITKIQVSKQADVMVLFLLLEELFPHQVKLSSWDYYEPRCLHDSSPNLPAAWKKPSYTLLWKGQKLNVTVTPRMVQITGGKQKEPVTLEVWGEEYNFQEELVVIKKFES